MCCFSQPVRHVSTTRIFARPTSATAQLLVYSMKLDADGDLAMVLPIPVPARSSEEAVRFVDMSSCPDFFDQLDVLFPEEPTRGFGAPAAVSGGIRPQSVLVVHDVGDFEASFVPTRNDFDRLDRRFRLPSSVWDALPAYADWGFCVFKLRSKSGAASAAAPGAEDTGHEDSPGFLDRVLGMFRPTAPSPPRSSTPSRDFHPMAFEFPRRDPTRLFFPTVHVHDGKVHSSADFDHALYCQLSEDMGSKVISQEWQRSSIPAGSPAALHGRSALAWLDPTAHAHRMKLIGGAPNRDVFI